MTKVSRKEQRFSYPKNNRIAQHGQVQTNRVSDYDEETGGVLVADDTGKDPMRILPTAFVKNSHPLQGACSMLLAAERAKSWDIPLFAAPMDLKKSVGPCGQTKHSSHRNIRVQRGVPQGAPESHYYSAENQFERFRSFLIFFVQIRIRFSSSRKLYF